MSKDEIAGFFWISWFFIIVPFILGSFLILDLSFRIIVGAISVSFPTYLVLYAVLTMEEYEENE